MIPAAILLVAVLVYRVTVALVGAPKVAGLQNFSPMAALILCGAVFLPRKWAVALPLLALFISDLLVNAHYGISWGEAESLPKYLAFALVAAFGWFMRGRVVGWRILGATLLSSVAFYVVTNTGAWMLEPQYAKSFGGWIQALTTGMPGYAPTWHFFRNTLVSDLIFTSLFLVCVGYRATAPEPTPSLVRCP